MAGLVWDQGLRAYVREGPEVSVDEAEWAAAAAVRAEERERVRLAAVAERQRAAAEQERAAAESKERATALLLSLLNKQQTADFHARQEFTVTGSDGKRYLIRLGRAHNIFELDDAGNRVVEICGHVSDRVPDEDNIAAQKLALEADAPGFRRIANMWAIPSRATVAA